MADPAHKEPVYNPHDDEPVTRPDLRDLGGGGEESGPRRGNLHSVPDHSADDEAVASSSKKARHLHPVEDSDTLAADEEGAAQPGATTAQREEAAQVDSDDNTVGEGYRKEKGGGLRSRLNLSRRQKTTGVIVGILVGGSFGAFSVLHGPFQTVHFAQLLQKFHFSNNEDFMDGRAGRYLRHMFSGSAEQARLGRVANKIATRTENRLQSRSGVRSIYSEPPYRRLIGYEVMDAGKAESLIKQLEAEGVNTNGKAPRGNSGVNKESVLGRYIDIDIGSGTKDIKYRRAVNNTVVKSVGLPKVAGSMAARLLSIRAGIDLHFFKNKKRQAGESLVEYYKERKEERSQRRKKGVNAPDGRLTGSEADTNGDGKPDQGQGSSESANSGNNFANEAKEAGGTPDGRKALVGKLTGGAAAVAQALCVINDTGNNIDDFKYQNNLVMMRMAFDVVAGGNQVMSPVQEGKDLNLDELGSLNDDFYDKEKKTSVASARSIQYENKQPLTGPDFPSDSKPGKGKPAFFEAVGSIPFINGGCGLSDQAKKIPIVGRLINITESAAQAGINGILGTLGYSIEEFYDTVIRFFAGEAVDTFAKGALLGNIINYGARLAANDLAIGMGGRALSAVEEFILSEAANEEDRRQIASQSLYERVLNPYNVDSLASSALVRLPRSPEQSMASVLQAPTSLLANILQLTGATAGAQATQTYDYGFPEYGFSQEEQFDERFDNPFDNAAIVEPRLAELNSKYGDCFAMTVDPATGNLQTKQAKRYEEIEKKPECHEGGNRVVIAASTPVKVLADTTPSDLLRYRFYLADSVAMHSLACYEGEEESCTQVGFGGGSPAAAAGVTGSAINGNPYTDSSNIECAPGTNTVGPADGYHEGQKFPIRLCSLPNLPSIGSEDNGFARVNSRMSGAWFKLVNDAKAAGVVLAATSSYRSNAHQTRLWNDLNQNAAEVAPPGFSSHQAGVAIDFKGQMNSSLAGDTCESRGRLPGNKYWEWMNVNSVKYGIKQYSAEAWHWDALPAANRCGPA